MISFFKALLGLALIGFGVIVFLEAVSSIRNMRRELPQKRTVLTDQSADWHAYIPPIREDEEAE